MFGMGTWEILIIFIVILLLFGSKRLPEIARGLGKGVRQFKKAANELRNEFDFKDIDKNLKG